MNAQPQAELFQAMAKPQFYPHRVSGIEQRDTHISKVFLTGDYAYKIKKPVNLGFLDFNDLENRQYYCEQEVTLNRRLAPRVYLAVVPITYQDGRYSLGGSTEPVEYAVKMVQLPENLSMLRLLRQGRLGRDLLDKLARRLAEFYGQASGGADINKFGSWQTVWINSEENFKETECFAEDLIDVHMFRIVRAVSRAFMVRRKTLFDRRVEAGKIRDCHGDLRTGHVYFSDGIQIIDCIEFNDRYRYGDIAADMAFLAMDLDFEGYPQVARHLLNSYLEYTNDEEMLVLMDFYKCYRACVRVKVNCLRLSQSDPGTNERIRLLKENDDYLNLAYRYAVGFTRPTVWVVCGLPASGKSTIAKALSKMLDVEVISSDVVRRKLFGLSPYEPQVRQYQTGIYSKEAGSLTYGKLLMLAQEKIEKGCSIILDAVYWYRHQRDEAIRLADDMDTNIIFVECTASHEILKKRLFARESTFTISDARLQHLEDMLARFEPMDHLGDDMHIPINTEAILDESMRKIISLDYFLHSHLTAAVTQKGGM